MEKRIMVVDDDPDILISIRRIFEKEGFEVFTVDSINYISGKKHVYINSYVNIIGIEEPLTFVEGSGPNAGFNYHRNPGGAYLSSFMMCHSKDSIKVQGNTMFMDSCEVCWVGIDELNHTSNHQFL